MNGRFATGTVVSEERTRAELERLLTRYGCASFGTGWDTETQSAHITFRHGSHARRVGRPAAAGDPGRAPSAPGAHVVSPRGRARWLAPTSAPEPASRWIEFVLVGTSTTGKTSVWEVRTRDGGVLLGHVTWFGRWRCYAFSPKPNTVYEQCCLRDLAAFCDARTAEHRRARAKGGSGEGEPHRRATGAG
jgi:hypothetical protein